MQDNTARQLVAPAPNEAPSPQAVPHQAPKVVAVPKPKPRFAPFERVLAALCGMAACVLCLLYLNTQNQLANANRTYQDVQAKIATQDQSVTDLKQTIGELSNSNRLSSFAKAHGLTVIEKNIKRVNK